MASPTLAAALIAVSLLTASAAQAQPGPKEHYAAESKRIAARYAEDKKLCAEEGSSSARMQCLRDAKKEYDQALSLAKAALKAGPPKPVACHDCGKVIAVRVGEKAGDSSAVGLIAGGVAGALLGNQVGSGHGRQLATVAGAAGGAYAGKEIEKKAKSSKVWTVEVEHNDGKRADYTFDRDPGLLSGDRVRPSNGSIVRD